MASQKTTAKRQDGVQCEVVSIARQIERLRHERQRAEALEGDAPLARHFFAAGDALQDAASHIQATSLAGALIQIRLAYLAVDELRGSRLTEDSQDALADRLDRFLRSIGSVIERHVGEEASLLACYMPPNKTVALVDYRARARPPG